MAGALNLGWLEQFRDTVNADEELAVIANWFTTTYSINFGEQRVAFRVNAGKIDDIVRDPRFDIRAIFGFSAPLEVWRRFFTPVPPPLYHDFFAMIMRVPEFVLEGDGLVAMQNARALHRTMSLMRAVGAEHV